jgi:serine/threonine-protein kinase
VADGTSPAERLTTSPNMQLPSGTNGTDVVFGEVMPTTSIDIMRLSLPGQPIPTPLVQTKFISRNGVVSPDGRWLAYESDSSGQLEIYVRPFRDAVKGQWQISPAGGRQPLWARNGKELFYVASEGALMSVPVAATNATWNAGVPTKLIDAGSYTFGVGSFPQRAYDVALDGRRFLLMKAARSDPAALPPAIIIVQHFDEELKRLVPKR